MKTQKKGTFSSQTFLLNTFLFISDLFGFAISFVLITLVRKFVLHTENSALMDPQVARTISLLVGFTLVMFILKGLYPGRGRISVIELKQVTEAILAAYAIVGVYIFIDNRAISFSRSIYLLSGVFEIGLITIGRILVRRRIVSTFSWWGEPVAIIGTRANIETVAKRLNGCRRLGFKPAVALSVDGDTSAIDDELQLLPWSLKEQEQIADKQINTVILAISTTELCQKYPAIYHSVGLKFKKTIFMLENDLYGSMMAQPVDLNGQPAVMAHQSLFNTSLRFVKWIFEIITCLLLAVPFLLTCLLVALLIKLDSKGPVFYSQTRIGKNLKPFKLLKFRTMYVNSDEILTQLLENPEIRQEWESYHKLTNDPRITRIGRWIRKFSLDETPQFFNVLRGEMSLIGPRPLVQAEIDQIGELANVVFRVRPGITGWWQVNGRNNLSFAERTQVDVYYVYNWSLWLDLYILIKTFWVLLVDRGGR